MLCSKSGVKIYHTLVIQGLTRHENGEAVVYGDAIPGSNFKSLFKLMVSNQQDLHQVGIDDFFRALRSSGVNNDKISGKP